MKIYIKGIVSMIPNEVLDIDSIVLENGMSLSCDEMEIEYDHKYKQEMFNDRIIDGYEFFIKGESAQINDRYANKRINELKDTRIDYFIIADETQKDLSVYIKELVVEDNETSYKIDGFAYALGLNYDIFGDKTHIETLYLSSNGVELKYNFKVCDGVDLIPAIKAVSKEYCYTEEGERHYLENNNSFKWNEFIKYVPDEMMTRHGFKRIKTQLEVNRHFNSNDNIIDNDWR